MSNQSAKFTFTADTQDVLKKLDEIKKHSANIQKNTAAAIPQTPFKQAEKKIIDFGFALNGITAAANLISPVLDALKAGFQDMLADENMTVLLAQFTKCQEAATTLQANLDHLAANGVVAIDDLAKAASKLSLHFGKNTTATTEWTRIFADIAASGITSADTLANTWSKVMANGFADSRALNQLQNVGIPIIKALAAELDVASYKVLELAKNKEISADTYCAAIRRMHSEEFEGLNSALSSTLSGTWDTLLATATNTLGAIATQATRSKTAIEQMNSAIAWLESLGDGKGLFSHYLANLDPSQDASLNPFRTALNGISSLIANYKSDTELLAAQFNQASIINAEKWQIDPSSISSMEDARAHISQLNTALSDLNNQLVCLDARLQLDPSQHTQKFVTDWQERIFYAQAKLKKHIALLSDPSQLDPFIQANQQRKEEEQTLARAAEKIPTIINRTLTTAGLNRNTYQTRLNSDLASLGLPEITTLEAYFHTLDSLKVKYTQGGITALTNDEVKTLSKLGETENHFREMLRIRDSLAGLTKKEIDDNSTAITQAKNELTLLNAILSGDEKHITNLKKQADIEAKKAQLIRSGMNAQSAASYASAIIGAKYDIEAKKQKDADAKKNRQEATTFLNTTLDRTFAAIRQTLTSTGHLGNGFSSGLNLSASPATIASAISALTAETKTANKHLQTIATWTTKNPTITPSGTPRFL